MVSGARQFSQLNERAFFSCRVLDIGCGESCLPPKYAVETMDMPGEVKKIHPEISERACRLHSRALIVDSHCDTLTALQSQERRLGVASQRGHVDLPRLVAANVKVQYFAAFIEPQYYARPLQRLLELIDRFEQELQENAGTLRLICSRSDLDRVLAGKEVGGLLTVEGGECLEDSLAVLRQLYRLGVRSITLTWNYRNRLADGVLESRTGGGLTNFGVQVVQEMNRLGMLVDLAHISEAGFWQALEVSSQPILVSHANCRAVCDHPRNLNDGQIRALAAAGGVVGLCFYPPFVHSAMPDLERLLDHAVHIASTGGVDCLGLGSDFDGIDAVLPGLEDVTGLPVLTEGLLGRGFSESDVEKILGGNHLRLLRQVLK
ncbi:MAG: dipeptidase [Desulfurispora sp.]|uniref:dipeptidase n=1 Tax=Desulfurispora sp. TaxID=3014275 RepID=UPI004049EEBB